MTHTAKYINPLTDFGFKKVFGNEDIMRDFLNDIIEPESPIAKLTFLDKEMPPETKYERGIIYDMRCMLDSGEEIIVEMQNRGQDYFKDRICYYMARAISSQGERGDDEWKFQLHAVYGVFFMNFHLKDKTSDDLHDIRHIALADIDTHDVFSKKLQLWLLELPRYRKMSEAECKSNKDYWLYNLTHLETMNTTVPFQTQKPIFHKLENIADMAQLTREERDYYNISLDAFRTNLAVMDHERNVGRKEGRLEGRLEGRNQRSYEIARNLLSMNLPIDSICQATGLSKEDIASL
jgi:predicted transposase/invertase (TIGR01784 family)